MDLLNKLTIKNLKLNKKRTTVTIIGIILSVALITAVAGVYFSGVSSLIKYETSRKGNFHYAFKNVPIDNVVNFKNNRKIESLFLCQHIGYAELKDSKNASKPYAHIMSFSKDALDNLAISLVEGRLPQNDNEIVIPTHLKTNGRVAFNVGDSIKLDVGKRVSEDKELTQDNPYNAENQEKIIDTNIKEYKIVGIIERPSNNIEIYSAPGYTFITLLDEKNITGNIDLYTRYTKEGLESQYKVTANIIGVDENLYEKLNSSEIGNEQELNKITEQMSKAKYVVDSNPYLIILEADPLKIEKTGNLVKVVIIVCLIIVFSSAFCIKNSFDISITEKIKQYGMLRSIGATKKQIRKNVFYEAFILGAVGIPLGIILGFLATYILIIVSNFFLKSSFMEIGIELQFAFSWLAVIIAVVLGIVTIYLSSRKSARKAGKVSPIDSIRNNEEIKVKSKELKAPKIITKLFGIGGEISYKNLKRNKRKYRTTVISIVVSTATFLALSFFVSSAFNVAKDEVNSFDYDINLWIGTNSKDIQDKVIETTKLENIEKYSILKQLGMDVPNIKYSEEYKQIQKDLKNEIDTEGYIAIYCVGNEEYMNYIKKLGLDYEKVKDKAILMDTQRKQVYNIEKNTSKNKTIRELDYKNGDIISGYIDRDDMKKPFKIEITLVTTERPLGMGNVNNSFIIVSDETFNSKVQANTPTTNIFYKSDNADKLQEEIYKILDNYDISVDNVSKNAKEMENLLILVSIFLYGFIIVISLIGITNIFNTITTNVNLRRREFAMLKSVGMTRKEFGRMIRLESIFMGIKSLLFGLPIGIVLSYLIYHFLVSESGIAYQLPVKAISICIIVVFLLIAIIMKYSVSKINEQNIIETIRNENI